MREGQKTDMRENRFDTGEGGQKEGGEMSRNVLVNLFVKLQSVN